MLVKLLFLLLITKVLKTNTSGGIRVKQTSNGNNLNFKLSMKVNIRIGERVANPHLAGR